MVVLPLGMPLCWVGRIGTAVLVEAVACPLCGAGIERQRIAAIGEVLALKEHLERRCPGDAQYR